MSPTEGVALAEHAAASAVELWAGLALTFVGFVLTVAYVVKRMEEVARELGRDDR